MQKKKDTSVVCFAQALPPFDVSTQLTTRRVPLQPTVIRDLVLTDPDVGRNQEGIIPQASHVALSSSSSVRGHLSNNTSATDICGNFPTDRTVVS